MPAAVRMLAPPDFDRRVDVPPGLVAEKLKAGFVVDQAPDMRTAYHNLTPGSHAGRAALVVASGPSAGLAGRRAVMEFVRERDCVVWGTNNAFNVLNGEPLPADYLVVLDDVFWGSWHRQIAAYLQRYPWCRPCLGFDLHEDRPYQRITIEMTRTPDTAPVYEKNRYFHGNSSGIAAAQMALHAGCSRVYLIGHDCRVLAGRTHGNGVRSGGELNGDYPQGKDMLAGYTLLGKHARGLGVDIVNLSPDSAIDPAAIRKEDVFGLSKVPHHGVSK